MILVWLQLSFSHLALFLNLAVVILSYLHVKRLHQANCNYFCLSAPAFGAKYNIFQLSAPVGAHEKTWIISIWLQFKRTYFEPTATISILLHLFRANVTRIETIWFFMFRANFNNFNLTAPFLSGVSYLFFYAVPLFRANFTKQWTLSNQLQFFPASCMCVCVCVWDIWECFKMTAPVPSHTQLFCSKAALLSIQLQLWGLVGCGTFDKSQFFAFANYLDGTDEKTQTNCIAKILISAWRVVGNLLLINVELDKNSQLFVVLINASQLFDDPSHCIFLMFANICWWWVPLKVYWGSQSLHFCMQKEKL